MILLSILLSGCCGNAEPPVLLAPEGATTGIDEVWELPLEEVVLGSTWPLEELEVTVTAGEHLTVGISDLELYAIPEADWSGRETITVEVVDRCGASDQVSFGLGVGPLGGACDTTLEYTAQGSPTAVYVAGDFNDWGRTPLEDAGGGQWTIDLPLVEGAYGYKLIEEDATERWTCDPEGRFFQCDGGYEPATWSDCTLGTSSCNSLLVVGSCAEPTLALDDMVVDRVAGTAEFTVSFELGSSVPLSGLGSLSVTLDGEPVAEAEGWDGEEPLDIELSGLSPTRHTLVVEAADVVGHEAEPLYVPFWMDDRTWETGLLYYVFVDRFSNGDPSLDQEEGSSHLWTDYMGGDWAGVVDELDYLDELGVTAIWLTAPIDNAEGVWGSKCGATFTGYHGYWPSSASLLEEHFGDEAALELLIDEAHARGMRVLVDWVANHVHSDHPYAELHPDWFNPQRLCDDGDNWDDIPEVCWFDPFLPDIDYYQPEPLVGMVDDAVWMVKRYGFDGYRVDAVKHMPHSVYWNFQTRVLEEIEHVDAGSDEDFYTVGETFDGDRGLIASYVNGRELDAQFDFPLYFTLRSAFIDHSADFHDLEASWQSSRSTFDGYVMSTFLGNHDVNRFSTVAWQGDWGRCADEDHLLDPAEPPTSDLPYDKLELAFTWLLTHEGLPLIYYGDEYGQPGHLDPDNRQLMRFGDELTAREAGTLDHVMRLGQARQDHPQLAIGTRTVWWEESDVWAWARVWAGQGALVVVNRSDVERTLTNGLAWAGLSSSTYLDVLTDAEVEPVGDQLTVTVPARSSVVLVEVP